ncbi:MAG: hypothetical protein BRD44_02385 [Bacteroidetes bacterium QS_7_67_15]|nr:MAG: hypothetical protein BRD44_02385 [Bacteroidetes bacterium QS_7_67_15]
MTFVYLLSKLPHLFAIALSSSFEILVVRFSVLPIYTPNTVLNFFCLFLIFLYSLFQFFVFAFQIIHFRL